MHMHMYMYTYIFIFIISYRIFTTKLVLQSRSGTRDSSDVSKNERAGLLIACPTPETLTNLTKMITIILIKTLKK